MLASSSSLLVLLTLITSSLTGTRAEPVRAKRLLFPRQNSSFGGWGLRMINCPAETQKCTGNSGCCPKDMVCVTSSLMGALACCPTKESCAEVIKTLPVCPDPSWTLWQNEDQEPFCCLPGQFGYQTAPGTFGPGSSCADPGMPVAASLLAKSLAPAQGSGSATATGTARSGATTTRGRSPATATPGSSEVDSAGAASETGGGNSSPSTPTDSSNTANSGLSTGAIAGIGAGAAIVGIALIGGGIWWGFKKGQQKGREGKVVVENFVPAPEYTVGGHGGGGGAPGTRGVMGVGAHEKPAGMTQAAEVYGTAGRRVEMQA
ncbi:unnamed protein product [Tuber melanosporum]|uniref:(Perigord truffle) hypothetical protein n=1 Tax=Tuber melanosporum (strain Mel28) TaxID=656061 RepID=D5GI76_TUBMM|nr:uncharacterized protein GSTUM_00008320001 [Tuber melanosporum]CAZ84219.1 unnamed protein product [Tuber melanosporum]